MTTSTITPSRADELREEIAELDHAIHSRQWEISALQLDLEIWQGERADLELELEACATSTTTTNGN